MAEARDIAVNREFIVSGFMSGQAFRLAVRVDTAATRLIRIGLRDFDQAHLLENELISALRDLDRTAKDVRKSVDKVSRRRREGVPSSGTKQTYMVRSLPSALAYRCAVAIDQIQRDIAMLGLVASSDVSKTANNAQTTISEAIALADNCVASILKKTDRRRNSNGKGNPTSGATSNESKAQSEPAEKKAGKDQPKVKPSKSPGQAVTASNSSAPGLKEKPTNPQPEDSAASDGVKTDKETAADSSS